VIAVVGVAADSLDADAPIALEVLKVTVFDTGLAEDAEKTSGDCEMCVPLDVVPEDTPEAVSKALDCVPVVTVALGPCDGVAVIEEASLVVPITLEVSRDVCVVVTAWPLTEAPDGVADTDEPTGLRVAELIRLPVADFELSTTEVPEVIGTTTVEDVAPETPGVEDAPVLPGAIKEV